MATRKKILIGILVIVILAGGWWAFKEVTSQKVGCDWRPPEDYREHCKAIAGYYFNGEVCISLGACEGEGWDLVEKGIPFKSLEECGAVCPKQVTITTDKIEYEQGETVKITIQNKEQEAVNICGPLLCTAADGFPAKIERYEKGEWRPSVVYCPHLESLRERRVPTEENFICYTLPPRSSIQLEIYNFYEGHKFERSEKVRIVYYIGEEKIPIYSNEFRIK